MTDLQDDLRLVAKWYGWEIDADWRIKMYSGTTPILSENIDWFLTPDGMVVLMDQLKQEAVEINLVSAHLVSGWFITLVSSGKEFDYKSDTPQEALVRAIAKMLRAEK